MIYRIKKCRSVGYRLHKESFPGRPNTPYIEDPQFERKFHLWKNAISIRHHDEATHITKNELSQIILEIKKDDPYAVYDRHAPINDANLRSVKTPEPRDISGKDWKQLFSQWIGDLGRRIRRPDFEYIIMVNTKSHKKGWESSQRPKTPDRNNFATYTEYEDALEVFVNDVKRLHNEAVANAKLRAIIPKLPKPVPTGLNGPNFTNYEDETKEEQ